MSVLQESKIANSKIGFQTRFNKYFQAIEDPVMGLAMEVPSTQETETYAHLGAVPQMTEWIDSRKLSVRRYEALSITNKEWANGVRLSRRDILNDKLGLLGLQIDELARKAKLHPGHRVLSALVNGWATTSEFGAGYDGVAFFAATHSEGGSTAQSNTSTAALSPDSYVAARTAMMQLVDEEGDTLGVMPTHLFVGPSNERNAREIVQGAIVPGPDTESVSNVMQGTAQVVVCPFLKGSYANYWYLADLSGPARPIIHQVNERVSTAMIPASGSPNDLSNSERLFMEKDLLFGAQYYGNVGYGLWQLIHGSKGTT